MTPNHEFTDTHMSKFTYDDMINMVVKNAKDNIANETCKAVFGNKTMTNEEIKSEIEKLAAEIKAATEHIAEIRKDCPHNDVSNGVYSWREGSYFSALICDACGYPVQHFGACDPF